MIGTLINASIIPPFSMVNPIGALNTTMINWFINVNPMNPHTTEGIAARSSMIILNVSLSFGLQNSDTNIAAPSPKGTAIHIAKTVTLKVPTIKAKAPYLLLFSEVGCHSTLVRNSFKSKPLKRKPAPSRNTKKKMPNTKIIELIPHKRINNSMAVSENGRFAVLFLRRMFIYFSCSLTARNRASQQSFDLRRKKSIRDML